MKEIKTNLAVSGIVIKNDKFLLLKRVKPPFSWCPPGGRVKEHEGFIEAVEREILEEAGIKVKIIMPISVWYGKHNQADLYSVDFLCKYIDGEVTISKEHSEASWFSLIELNKLEVTHDLSTFNSAKKLFNLLN